MEGVILTLSSCLPWGWCDWCANAVVGEDRQHGKIDVLLALKLLRLTLFDIRIVSCSRPCMYTITSATTFLLFSLKLSRLPTVQSWKITDCSLGDKVRPTLRGATVSDESINDWPDIGPIQARAGDNTSGISLSRSHTAASHLPQSSNAQRTCLGCQIGARISQLGHVLTKNKSGKKEAFSTDTFARKTDLAREKESAAGSLLLLGTEAANMQSRRRPAEYVSAGVRLFLLASFDLTGKRLSVLSKLVCLLGDLTDTLSAIDKVCSSLLQSH